MKNVTLISQPVYQGCYQDTNARVLPSFVDLTNYIGWNSLYYCSKQAIAAQSTYFGLQFGYWCFYGTVNNPTQLGTLVADSMCNLQCSGNQNGKLMTGPNCGGVFYNSIYSVPV